MKMKWPMSSRELLDLWAFENMLYGGDLGHQIRCRYEEKEIDHGRA